MNEAKQTVAACEPLELAVSEQGRLNGRRSIGVHYLYAASPPGGLTGGPLCALEHLKALRSVFSGVCLVLCEQGPLEDRARAAGVSVLSLPFVYRGLRRGCVAKFIRGIGPVLRSRSAYVAGLCRLLKEHPGILHIHSRAAHLPYALLAGWLARVPVVVSIHEPGDVGQETWLDLWMIRRFADWVVFPADGIQRQYPGLLEGRRSILRYYHDLAPLRRVPSTPHVPRLAMLGRMGHRKGYDIFLAACRMLHNEGISFSAWLGGGGWGAESDRARAHHFIRENHLENAVSDLDLLPDISSLYDQIDVLLLTSRRDPLPRVVMEAMCHGIPVVATRVDGIPEMVEDGVTGILVEPEDAEGFAAAVKRLLENEPLRLQMGAAGRERAKRLFSPDTYRERMMAIYGKLEQGM